MSIDLQQLPKLKRLFKLFSSGAHLNRLQATELWFDLENRQTDYEQLFSALGFHLVIDSRGFAYFKTEQGTGYTSKLTRRLALLIMLLFEYQADQGQHLFQFQQWRIDAAVQDTLWKKYQSVLQAEEFDTRDSINEVLDAAGRIGFVKADPGGYQLLPAVHRYLDLFEELLEADRPDSDNIDEQMENPL